MARHAKAGGVFDTGADHLSSMRVRMRGQFQSEPAIGGGQFERGYANAFNSQQCQLHGLRISWFAKLGWDLGGFRFARQSGDTQQSGGTQKTAEFSRFKRARNLCKVSVAGPRERFARIEWRGRGMCAGQAVCGHHEFAVAGDAAVGIPAIFGNEAIQDQGLERGTGGGESARCFAEAVRGQQVTGAEIEYQDSCFGSHARGAINRSLPAGRRSGAACGAQHTECDSYGDGSEDFAHTESMRHGGGELH